MGKKSKSTESSRCLPSSLWEWPQVCEMSAMGKLVYLFLVTGTMSRKTPPGIACAGIATIAEAGSADREQVVEALGELEDLGVIVRDQATHVIWLPGWMEAAEPPANPNVLIHRLRSADQIPECALRDRWVQEMLEHAQRRGAAFARAAGKAIDPALLPQSVADELVGDYA